MQKNNLNNPNNKTSLLDVKDVIESTSMQQLLEKEVQDLATHNRELNAFVYTVAHELKNPISSMIGFADLVNQYHDRMSSDEILENVRTTIDIGQHMITILDGLLMLAQLDHSVTVEMTPLDMHPIIEHVNRSLNNDIREYRVHIHLPEDWPSARGYTPWVETVWMNYISNAIKYGGSPPVIRLGAETTDNSYARFWVQDNGAGLSREEQQQLFHPFVRLRKHEAEGHGLGLTVVKKIVERLQGSILLESEVGKGSRFGFTLPMV